VINKVKRERLQMNSKEWEKRKSEAIKYNDTIFDEASAIESGYAILGGKNHSVIVEAIVRVYDRLIERYEDFVSSDEFLNCKEEQEAYKQAPLPSTIIWATHILIDLLREDGYLRENIGDAEENKLYADFYVLDDTSKALRYNPLSTLSNCLKCVIEKYKNADKYKDTPLLSDGISCIRKAPIKRELFDALTGKPVNKKIKGEINEKEFLNRNLVSGQTFAQLLLEVHAEYIKNTSDDLIFEIKMLSFAQTILKESYPARLSNYPESIKVRLTQDDIWKFFLKRDKTGRYATYDKGKILKKLWTYQNKTITFVEMRGNEPVLVSRKLYEFDEILLPNKSEYYLSIDTSPIDFYFKNYLYMDTAEMEKLNNYINEYWRKISKTDTVKSIEWIIKKINSNQHLRAVPIKLNILLKYRYHWGNNFENKKTGYRGNYCHISDEQLKIGLGDIDSEITRVLQATHCIQKGKDTRSKVFKLIQKCVLGFTFYCAKKLKWIVSFPIHDKKKQEWIFNLNTSYFDPKAKVENLKIWQKND
jgi:hypothetical protein